MRENLVVTYTLKRNFAENAMISKLDSNNRIDMH